MSRYQSESPEGQPSHTPKIRIRGIEPGSAQHNAVVDAHAGALRQFHAAQQQQVKLSGQRVYKASRSVPGARMTYHNNEGQETITMVVETTSGGEEQEVTKDEYWQWAIVETTIPGMTHTSAEMSAFMNPPPKAPNIGVSWEENISYDFDRTPLAYPGDLLSFSDELQILSGQTDQVSSLRVDLRPYPGGVKFDLYGYIHSYVDPDGHGPANSSVKRAGQRANDISTGSWTGTWHSSSGLLSGSMPSASDISGRTQDSLRSVAIQSIVNDQFPETIGMPFASTTLGTLNSDYQNQGPLPNIGASASIANGPPYTGLSLTWSPGSGNDPTAASFAGLMGAAGGLFTETTTYWDVGGTIIAKQRGLGFMDYYANSSTGFVNIAQNGAGPIDANGNYGFSCWDYTAYWLASFDPLTVFPTRAGPVRFAVFDGKEPHAYTQLNGVSGGFGSRKRWEDAKRGISHRWPFKQIAVANIKSIDDPIDTSIENHFGMLKLGTVIINPRKGRGGIKFIAA